MNTESLNEHARIGRGLVCLAVIVGVGLVARSLMDQFAVWTESEQGAGLLGIVIGICLFLLALTVFSVLRSGAKADEQAEKWFAHRDMARFKSRVDAARPTYGGKK